MKGTMTKRWFWIVIISIHILCFVKQLFFDFSLLQDSKEYLFAADNLIQYNSLYSWNPEEAYNPNWLTKRPIFYPLILAFFKIISFDSNDFFTFFLLFTQNILSLFTINIAVRSVTRLKGKMDYKIAALLILFTPAQAIYANLVMSEIWLQAVIVTAIYNLLFYPYGIRKISYLVLLCIGAMALKPVMIFIALLLPLYVVYHSKMAFKPLIISVIPLIYLISVSYHNKHRTGYFHYSSISTINLFQYNTYTLLLNKYGQIKADSIVDEIQLNASRLPDYGSKQKYLNEKCIAILKSNKTTYAFLHLRGLAFCILDPGRFDITQFFNLPHPRSLLYEVNKKNNWKNIWRTFLNPLGIFLSLIFLANLFKLYMGIRFLFLKTIVLPQKLILLLIPTYLTLLTGPIGSSRFALPFFPIYLIIILFVYDLKKSVVSNQTGNND